MLLVCLGTRPELLKIEPLLKYWKSIEFHDYKIWLSFQHEELCIQLKNNWEFSDYIINKVFFANYNLANRLDSIVYSILNSFGFYLKGIDFKHVLVQGDTATAYACALSAFHHKISIIHLEAGLRSYDNSNPYPEEFYRRSISMMASTHLCPTQQNCQNLKDEKCPGEIYQVGNTILDNIKDIKPTIENKILITLHRRENLDKIQEWFCVIERLAEKYSEYEFILPIHPNPQIYQYKTLGFFKKVKCIDALEHDDLIDLLSKCKAVVTDSGGICEEGSVFGKPIFLCRKETERPEGEDFYIWCKEPQDLEQNFNNNISNLQPINKKSPFGDGNSCEYITKILLKL